MYESELIFPFTIFSLRSPVKEITAQTITAYLFSPFFFCLM
jgi:hypothetical protein